MEIYRYCMIGIASNDFVMIAADQTNVKGVFILKDDEDKIHELSDSLMIGLVGEDSETSQFVQFIKQNLALYTLKNSYSLDVAPTVSFIRKNYADKLSRDDWVLRRNPPAIYMLLAGHDAVGGCQLYLMDYLATCIRVPYACTGFGGILSLGILDQYYKNNMTETEAYEVLQLCCKEIQRRLIFSLPKFCVKVICKNGVHELPPIKITGDAP